MEPSGDHRTRQSEHPLRWRVVLLVITVFWSYVSFTVVAQWELQRHGLAKAPTLSLGSMVATCLMLFPLLVALTYLSWRVGHDMRRWRLQLLTHFGLAIVFGFSARPCMVMSLSLATDISLSESMTRLDGPSFYAAIPLYAAVALFDIMQYLVLQSLLIGLSYYVRFRQERALRENLAAQYDRARLNALRMQISPHFLYNTLSAIVGLVRINPPAAENMVTRLGELFRRALAENDRELVTLEQELEYAENYLEIQRIRFAERLTYRIDVETHLRAVLVPPLLLQPLLENAVEHGLRASEGTVQIGLTCRACGTRVEVVIRNRSEGEQVVAPTQSLRRGLGLRNVRERIEAAFPGAGELHFQRVAAGEYESRLSFPSLLAATALT